MTPDLHDTLTLVGAALVAAGVWWIYPPAALILLGAVLVGIGVLRRPTAAPSGREAER